MLRSLLALTNFDLTKEIKLEKLPNEYWPDVSDYQKLRDESPWWLITFSDPKVTLKIGWRKRVIQIEWSDYEGEVLGKDVVLIQDNTYDKNLVHAWGYSQAIDCLNELHYRLEQETFKFTGSEK